MSLYVTVQGVIKYPSQERLAETIKMLQKDGWMKEHKFVDETDNVVDDMAESDVDLDRCVLTIPLGLYRSLGSRLNEMTKDTTGNVVWTCTDGCFDGGRIVDGEEQTFDLTAWAKENMPEEESEPPDFDEDFDGYCEWQSDVEAAFHEEMS